MNIPLYGDAYRKLFGNMATLHPSAQDAPNMTVKISAGGFWSWLEGVAAYVEYVGGSSPAITAPSGNAKWVVVTLNASGMVVNIDGAESATPILPVIPANRYPIALVYAQSGDTKLTDEYIFDARPIFANPIRSHADLMGTTTDGCHTTAAIDGLDALIATLATLTNLSDGLADKADVGGTNSAIFKLNQDQTGTPSSDAYLEVERGDSTNVSIMWSESREEWMYTNNGAAWYYLSGAYYNDGSQDLVLKVYDQNSEPTLDTDQKAAIWQDANDSDRIYLVFRRGTGDQVKVELT
jgi:hypothetical protein